MEKVFISWSFWLWSDHTVYIYPYKNCQTISQSCYTIFFTVLGFELRAYTWVTPPALFCDGTGSHKLFAWAGFKLQLSWSLSPEYLRTTGVSHWCLAFLKIHIVCKNSFSLVPLALSVILLFDILSGVQFYGMTVLICILISPKLVK
jgi:hypothetical protein